MRLPVVLVLALSASACTVTSSDVVANGNEGELYLEIFDTGTGSELFAIDRLYEVERCDDIECVITYEYEDFYLPDVAVETSPIGCLDIFSISEDCGSGICIDAVQVSADCYVWVDGYTEDGVYFGDSWDLSLY